MISRGRQTTRPAIALTSPLIGAGHYDEAYDFRFEVAPGLYPATARDRAGNVYSELTGSLPIIWIPKNKAEYKEQVIALLKLAPNGKASVLSQLSADRDYMETDAHLGIARLTSTAPIATALSFRRELVYTGRSGSSIALLYREFKDDMARPAFSQQLQYDISADPVIGYQGARFRILAADNTSITYEVLQHLSE